MEKIVVSVTSFPNRIKILPVVIENILNQTKKPDLVVVYLSSFEFPNRFKDLPIKLMSLLQNKRVELKWCQGDLRCHKKYYFAMQEYPDDIIITVDDDMIYDCTLIETLYNSYKQFPFAVSAARAHFITFEKNGNIKSYNDWLKECDELVGIPSHRLFVTSVGGVLYPPKSVHPEAFNKESFLRLAHTQDDIWLKIMQLMNDTPVVVAPVPPSKIILRAQTKRLASSNVQNGRNDTFMQNCIREYDHYFGKADSLTDRMKKDTFFNKDNFNLIENEYFSQINKIKKSIYYKIGDGLAFAPKKIISFITK